jgi:hypothetical protein
MVPEVIARLQSEVPQIRSIEPTLSFAAIMASGGLPQVTPAAYVVGSGTRGGAVNASAGAFVQDIDETVAVVLVFRTNTKTGGKAVDVVEETRQAIRDALCGWAPAGAMSLFRLVTDAVVTLAAGTVVTQAEFALADQLRILQ